MMLVPSELKFEGGSRPWVDGAGVKNEPTRLPNRRGHLDRRSGPDPGRCAGSASETGTLGHAEARGDPRVSRRSAHRSASSALEGAADGPLPQTPYTGASGGSGTSACCSRSFPDLGVLTSPGTVDAWVIQKPDSNVAPSFRTHLPYGDGPHRGQTGVRRPYGTGHGRRAPPGPGCKGLSSPLLSATHVVGGTLILRLSAERSTSGPSPPSGLGIDRVRAMPAQGSARATQQTSRRAMDSARPRRQRGTCLT
jgi:hypothetical protein